MHLLNSSVSARANFLLGNARSKIYGCQLNLKICTACKRAVADDYQLLCLPLLDRGANVLQRHEKGLS